MTTTPSPTSTYDTIPACAYDPAQPCSNDVLLHSALNQFGYVPSVTAAIVFIVLFAISGTIHIWQAFRPRKFVWMIVMSVGCLAELVGWASRIWARYDIEGGGYIAQICCLIIGPTFYSAALYMILGVLINDVAPLNSKLTSLQFKIIFMAADVLSLVLQAIGGGMAATSTDPVGGWIMLSGIAVQLVVMLIYVMYALWWAAKSRSEIRQAGKGVYWILCSMFLASLCIIIRGVFRTAELSEGFDGPIATDQSLFLLDAIPISIATFVLNVLHPHLLLRSTARPGVNSEVEMKPPRRSSFESALTRTGSETPPTTVGKPQDEKRSTANPSQPSWKRLLTRSP